MSYPDVRALTFDVFGTVVDWRGSIVREGERLARAKGLAVDWGRLADAGAPATPPPWTASAAVTSRGASSTTSTA